MRLAIAAFAVELAGCSPAETRPTPRPPHPPSCVQVADHIPELVDLDRTRERRVQDLFHARCSADRWAGDVRACIVDTRSFADGRHCKARLTPAQRAAFDRDLAAAMNVEPPRSRMPPECADYGAAMEKVAACDKLPAATRDALRRAYEQSALAWRELRDDELFGAAAGCRAAADAIKQVATSVCGW